MRNGHDVTVERVVEMRAAAVQLGGESMRALVMANGVHGPLDALPGAAQASSLPALAELALVGRWAAVQPDVRSAPVHGAPDAASPRVPAGTLRERVVGHVHERAALPRGRAALHRGWAPLRASPGVPPTGQHVRLQDSDESRLPCHRLWPRPRPRRKMNPAARWRRSAAYPGYCWRAAVGCFAPSAHAVVAPVRR